MERTNQSNQSQTRRGFLKTSGTLMFFASIPLGLSMESCEDSETHSTDYSAGQKLNLWIEMNEAGQVKILNPASEMGQGSMTALAVIIAEEMDLDWKKVFIENSPVEPDLYGAGWGGRGSKSMITVGSRTVMSYFNMLRQIGAQARYVLLKSTADFWEVPIEELSTNIHKVVHDISGKTIDYGEILKWVNNEMEVPEIPEEQLKKVSERRLLGKNIDRFDIPSKVDGSAQYSIDVDIPDLLFAAMERSPVNGSKPTLLNESEILGLPDIIQTVSLEHGVAVIAEKTESALLAKSRLKIEWSLDTIAYSHNSDNAYNDYMQIADKPGAKMNTIHSQGNVRTGFSNSIRNFQSDYKNDYIYHGQMEPLNAIASINEDDSEIEILVGTQAPGNVKRAVARALDIDQSKVKMNRFFLGGGFGRRSSTDYVLEAVELTRAIRRPVKLIWTREDDLKYGMFRPISLQRMKAGIDANGKIIAWEHKVIGTGGGLLASGAEPQYYDIPNQKIGVYSIDHGIRTKHWRAVAHGPNKFAIEAFIDEIAIDQKMDPLEFRLQMMSSERAKNVLKTAAEMANWTSNPADGRAKGLAFAERSGSLSACVVELSYNENNGIRVHKVWASLDAGVVVQPDNAIAQMEGAIIMGIGSVLKERISIVNGVVQESNYNDYEILRIDECPELIKVKIIDSEERPTGIGESGIPIIAGAISNAFAALTGVRLRHLPFSVEKIKSILS